MNTIPEQRSGRSRRRKHSDEFKADAVAGCMQPGISMAAVAMSHGINANLLRRWVRDAEMKPQADSTRPVTGLIPKPAFLPVTVPAVAKGRDIRIELRRGAMSVIVDWPADAAGECAAWMRELLR